MNPMKPDEVREARQALGLTQSQLADLLELKGPYGKDTVRAWESGQRFKFGAVRFTGTAPFPQEFLQQFVPWKEGAYFNSEQVLNLRRPRRAMHDRPSSPSTTTPMRS